MQDLAGAVAAAITHVGRWSGDRRAKECDQYADLIASGGDALWAEPGRAHEVRPEQVHEAVINGLAVLAHRSGGVTFGGLHWHAGACLNCPGPGAWTLAEAVTGRQDRGAFFTPRALAEEVTRNAIGPHATDVDQLATTSIADIACGTGAFLLAATRYVTDAHLDLWNERDADYFQRLHNTDNARTAATRMALARVYGVDIDPLSIELARLALALLIPDQPVDLSRIRTGDALLGAGNPRIAPTPENLPDTPARFDWPTEFPEVFANPDDWCCGFEVIIGNPPYLGGQKLTGVLGRPYVDHLITNIAGNRRGSADLAVYFYLRAHELASQWGTVGIIGPVNLCKGGNSRVWEDHLAGLGWNAYNHSIRKWPSKSAAVAICIRFTSNLLPVDSGHKSFDPDDTRAFKYPDVRHTCGFDVLTPGEVERLRTRPENWIRGGESAWPMYRDCPRCTAINADDGFQVYAWTYRGEVREGIVHEYNGLDAIRPLIWAT